MDSAISIASSDSHAYGAEPHSYLSSSLSTLPPPHGASSRGHSEIYSPQPKADSSGLEAARQYEELMDDHSLHEFMIRYGHTLSSTPEFGSYQRVYAALWPIIAQLIMQLEGICAEYAVPLVVVDGKVKLSWCMSLSNCTCHNMAGFGSSKLRSHWKAAKPAARATCPPISNRCLYVPGISLCKAHAANAYRHAVVQAASQHSLFTHPISQDPVLQAHYSVAC